MGCRSWMQSLVEVVSLQLLLCVYYRIKDDRDTSRVYSIKDHTIFLHIEQKLLL